MAGEGSRPQPDRKANQWGKESGYCVVMGQKVSPSSGCGLGGPLGHHEAPNTRRWYSDLVTAIGMCNAAAYSGTT